MLKFLSPLYIAGQKLAVAGQLLKCRLAILMGPSVEDILNSGSSAMQDGGAFKEASGKVDEFGGGIYHIGFKVMVYIVLLAIMGAGAALVLSNAQNREERKGRILWIVLGAVLVFGAGGMVAFLATTGSSLF